MNLSFAFGYIVGTAQTAIIFVILAFFGTRLEKRVQVTRAQIEALGTKTKGGIFLPEDENEITRQERINQNKAAGKDTPLSELR